RPERTKHQPRRPPRTTNRSFPQRSEAGPVTVRAAAPALRRTGKRADGVPCIVSGRPTLRCRAVDRERSAALVFTTGNVRLPVHRFNPQQLSLVFSALGAVVETKPDERNRRT